VVAQSRWGRIAMKNTNPKPLKEREVSNKKSHVAVAALFAAAGSADATNTITRGSWDLYSGTTPIATGLPNEQSCVDVIIARTDPAPTIYTCREKISALPVAAPAPAPSPAPPSPGVIHSSSFGSDEFPLSEGGRWTHTPNSWTFVQSQGGSAFGSNGITNSYDDSYAYLGGVTGDYTIRATVRRQSTCSSSCELELLLRVTDDSNNARAVEMLFDSNGTVQPVRWNGPFGSFYIYGSNDSCPAPWTPSSELRSGDVIVAQASGNTFRAWVNGMLKACVVDATMSKGAPGIGFFIRPGVTNNALSISDVTVSTP